MLVCDSPMSVDSKMGLMASQLSTVLILLLISRGWCTKLIGNLPFLKNEQFSHEMKKM